MKTIENPYHPYPRKKFIAEYTTIVFVFVECWQYRALVAYAAMSSFSSALVTGPTQKHRIGRSLTRTSQEAKFWR